MQGEEVIITDKDKAMVCDKCGGKGFINAGKTLPRRKDYISHKLIPCPKCGGKNVE